MVLLVLLAGIVPAVYCSESSSPGFEEGLSWVMAALGLCALGLAMTIGLGAIVLTGLGIWKQWNTALVSLALLSLVFDAVVFLPRAQPALQASSWVLIPLIVYPPVVLGISVAWLWREHRRTRVPAPPGQVTSRR